MAKKYNIAEIILAIPSLDSKSKAEILNICKETKCKVKVIPGMYELLMVVFRFQKPATLK